MTVNTATAEYRSFRNGEAYYFCSAGCKGTFDKDPEKFAGAGAKAAPKGP
jgi:Cu+-exporting ATPase